MNKRNFIILILIFSGIAIIAIIYLSNNYFKKEETKVVEIKKDEPEFVKHGTLQFISINNANQLIKTIDIEIAKDEYSREKGMMYRRNMMENQGMLFVFEDASPRYFWMKNTYISLDIIYVGKDKKIVSIQKSAVPLSEESLPSYKDAMYVVEVIAGFADKFKINEGDSISFN
jgi:uncharacterized membrane protein (UPF0127 family)